MLIIIFFDPLIKFFLIPHPLNRICVQFFGVFFYSGHHSMTLVCSLFMSKVLLYRSLHDTFRVRKFVKTRCKVVPPNSQNSSHFISPIDKILQVVVLENSQSDWYNQQTSRSRRLTVAWRDVSSTRIQNLRWW